MARATLIAVVVAVLALAFASAASADPVPTFTNPCAADLDPGSCERLTYVAGQAAKADELEQLAGWIMGGVLVLVVVPVLMRTFGRES